MVMGIYSLKGGIMDEKQAFNDIVIQIVSSEESECPLSDDDEAKVRSLMTTKVLPLTEATASHWKAQVEIHKTADGSPSYLEAALLRRDTYTADIVRVDIDAQFGFLGIENSIAE
jgi:hypothetical protein